MLLAMSIAFAFIFISIKPLSDGLMNTSMWVSKLSLPLDTREGEITTKNLKTSQAALLDGWLSNIPFLEPIVLLSSAIMGFCYLWWVGIIILFITLVLASLTSIIFTRSVTHYLFLLSHKMINRAADYRKKQDFERYEAAESFNKDLLELITIYENSRLKPPTAKELKEIPYGDFNYWLNQNKKISELD